MQSWDMHSNLWSTQWFMLHNSDAGRFCRLGKFYSTPIVKCFVDAVSYAVFVILYTFMVLQDFSAQAISNVEYVVLFWVCTLTLQQFSLVVKQGVSVRHDDVAILFPYLFMQIRSIALIDVLCDALFFMSLAWHTDTDSTPSSPLQDICGGEHGFGTNLIPAFMRYTSLDLRSALLPTDRRTGTSTTQR